jgi:hypothetical protein
MSYLDDLKNSIAASRVSQDTGAAGVTTVNTGSVPGVLLESVGYDTPDYGVDLQFTQEELDWGCRQALLELNDDDPILCEQVKRYDLMDSEDVFGLVFEGKSRNQIQKLYDKAVASGNKSKASSLKMKLDSFGKKKTHGGDGAPTVTKAAEKALERATRPGTGPGGAGKSDTLAKAKAAKEAATKAKKASVAAKLKASKDAQNAAKSQAKAAAEAAAKETPAEAAGVVKKAATKQAKKGLVSRAKGAVQGMSGKQKAAAGALTVAAVTALAYAAYKKRKNKKKSEAAAAAAKQSAALAKQAESQGRTKAAAQARDNQGRWTKRAEKYRAKGE